MRYPKHYCDNVKKKQYTMAYSAEESSPIEYFESCCICEEEFSSDSELTNHLLSHANDEEFKSSLKKFEENNSSRTPVTSRLGSSTLSKTVTSRDQTLKRSFTQRSKSPEVWEIVSDDSDDESSKNKKTTGSSSSFRLVKTPSSPNTPAPKSAPKPAPAKPPPEPVQNGVFTCQQCLLVFKDAKLYKEHLQTHDKAKPYSCQICNKKFAYKGTLRQHLHLHIGEKSHECKICHKKFSLKRMLRQHEETHETEQRQGQVANIKNKT